MNVLNTYGMASVASCIGIALASIAIFGLHHHFWRRIGSCRRPLDASCLAAVERALRPRPVIASRAPRVVQPETVH